MQLGDLKLDLRRLRLGELEGVVSMSDHQMRSWVCITLAMQISLLKSLTRLTVWP